VSQGTDNFLEYEACDQCQHYFRRQIECFVFQKTPFGFWRTVAGTLAKKGKSPAFDSTQNQKEDYLITILYPIMESLIETGLAVIIHLTMLLQG